MLTKLIIHKFVFQNIKKKNKNNKYLFLIYRVLGKFFKSFINILSFFRSNQNENAFNIRAASKKLFNKTTTKKTCSTSDENTFTTIKINYI